MWNIEIFFIRLVVIVGFYYYWVSRWLMHNFLVIDDAENGKYRCRCDSKLDNLCIYCILILFVEIDSEIYILFASLVPYFVSGWRLEAMKMVDMT